jgi:hypothetical protein
VSEFYDRDGQPIDLSRWGELCNVDGYRRIAETFIGPYRVSTVWLGLDHNFWPGGTPLIFETMVFGGDRDCELWRYSTEAEAAAGHEIVVAGLRVEQGVEP